MSTALVHFDNAKKELTLAASIDEVKDIRNKAEALRMYMKQSGETLEMQNKCAEIKIRAERRAGELLKDMQDKGEVQKQSENLEINHPRKTNVNEMILHDEISLPKTLSEVGITPVQSHRWKTLAAMPEDEFEQHIQEKIEKKEELTSGGIYREARKLKHPPIQDVIPLPSDKYRVIYADPPWKYGNTMPEYFTEQADHYSLMSLDEICDMPIDEISEDNAVLFLWVTSPILEESFEVIKAWGFKYKASFVWDKIKHNMGHYNSVRHEFLLVCVKGSCQPDIQKLYDSVVTKERSKHSEKPKIFREMIDTIYPNGKRIELFARKKTQGWDTYGSEIS